MKTHKSMIFVASCLALAVTAFIFIIRGYIGADIMRDIAVDGRPMTNAELGWISSMAFFGFAASILVASPLLDFFGMKRTLLAAGVLQVAGLAAFVTTGNYQVLVYSMLIAGFGNGLVEAVINPLAAALYPDEKTARMNILHAWWPGGLIIGGLVAVFIFKQMGLSWRIQMGTVLVPAVVYMLMVLREQFPPTERAAAGVSFGEMAREVLRPGYLLLMLCMMMTASAELAPNQWVEGVLTDITGTSGTLILVYGSLLMFVLRYFAGPIAHAISPIGMMWASCGLTFIGLYFISGATNATQAYLFATVFYLGVCFMWPTMLGIAAERYPKGGAMTIGFLGFIGQVALGIVIFKVGGWKDEVGPEKAFKLVSVLPLTAFAIFGAWWFKDRLTGGYKAINLTKEMGLGQEPAQVADEDGAAIARPVGAAQE
jgi:MFS family permease